MQEQNQSDLWFPEVRSTNQLQFSDTGPAPLFTPEQETRIREIVFAMTRLALENARVQRGEPAVMALTDDFWREPDGSIPPKPLTQNIPAG